MRTSHTNHVHAALIDVFLTKGSRAEQIMRTNVVQAAYELGERTIAEQKLAADRAETKKVSSKLAEARLKREKVRIMRISLADVHGFDIQELVLMSDDDIVALWRMQ